MPTEPLTNLEEEKEVEVQVMTAGNKEVGVFLWPAEDLDLLTQANRCKRGYYFKWETKN